MISESLFCSTWTSLSAHRHFLIKWSGSRGYFGHFFKRKAKWQLNSEVSYSTLLVAFIFSMHLFYLIASGILVVNFTIYTNLRWKERTFLHPLGILVVLMFLIALNGVDCPLNFYGPSMFAEFGWLHQQHICMLVSCKRCCFSFGSDDKLITLISGLHFHRDCLHALYQ